MLLPMIKRSFSKALIVLNLLLPAFGTRAIGPSTSEDTITASSEMKVLTWNIYMLPHFNWINANHRRARGLAQELCQSDYTIIVFQEAFDNGARKIIREVLKKNFPFFMVRSTNLTGFPSIPAAGFGLQARSLCRKKLPYFTPKPAGSTATPTRGLFSWKATGKGNLSSLWQHISSQMIIHGQ